MKGKVQQMTRQASGRTWLRNGIRQFNKRVYNPLIRTFAGRWLYAVVHHVGRRSGKAYATPVVAEPSVKFFFIPLPYGVDADWYRNIMAAGCCSIQWRGQTYELASPQVVAAADALPAFAPLMRISLRAAGIRQYLKLERLDGTGR